MKPLQSEIQKLFDSLAKLDKQDVYPKIFKKLDEFDQATKNLQVLLKLTIRVAKAEFNMREVSLVGMAIFLWLFEGPYISRLDLICFLLIENGHDLFDPVRQKFVSSFEEIGETNISTKFKFLERHKLEMLIRRQDQRLRNKIAHNDFALSEKGFVIIDSQVVKIATRIGELQTFLFAMGQLFFECSKKAFQNRVPTNIDSSK